MFKKARTAAHAQELIEGVFRYQVKGDRKSVFKRQVNLLYPLGFRENDLACMFMFVQMGALSDDYSPEKERWVNETCDRIEVFMDYVGGTDNFDVSAFLRDHRNRFKPKRTTKKKTKSKPKSRAKPKAKAKAKAKRKADTYDWDNYYEQLIELDGCGPKTAQIIISKVQKKQELTDREYDFWDQIS